MKLHCQPRVCWSVVTLSMGLAKAAVAATSNDPATRSIFNPASTPAHDIYHLSLFVMAICLGIFLVVFSLIMYAAMHTRAARPNLFIKIPSTQQGLPAIEEAIFAGVSVNVTLLFSREHYVAAAGAYQRGIERRIAAGLAADAGSVASVFISRWDVAVFNKVPEALQDRLGIAIAKRIYKAYRDLLGSPDWKRIVKASYNPQRLPWASTGTKDPKASDVLYIKALAAPNTVNTMPEGTLKALADHGNVGPVLPADGGDCEQLLAQFVEAGVDIDGLGAQLQEEGAKSFDDSWNELMKVIASKSATIGKGA